jgi:molybdopterin-biosynthesis enzyme MoeA-like protein
LRENYNYVFTSGGIGPTHDDITADCIATAFGAEINIREDAFKLLQNYYLSQNIDFNNSRQRMARIPNGAKLIENPISVAPGFQLENVFVMAGVPNIFQSMVQSILPSLLGGKPLLSKSIKITRGEGEIAANLKKIASDHEKVSIGSYPYNNQGKFGTNIVVRGIDSDELDVVAKKLMSTLL